MATDTLTDAAIRVAGVAKPTRMFDGRGLYLEVKSQGGKSWRLKYRFGGKEKLLSMGTYPDTSLRQARQRREEARALLASGVDPSAARKASKMSGSAAGVNLQS